MKLLLDEHFSPEIARQLRNLGHDVVATQELGVMGASDRELLALAALDRRAVVTENVGDFMELHRSATITQATHFGLVFTSSRQFPRTRRTVGRLVRALDALLTTRPSTDALLDQTWWLNPLR